MSPMNPRLMRPLAAGNRLPVFATAGYTRLWAVTTQSGGDITGSAETDTGYYAVKWWDNTVDIYDSGDPFSKAALGNQRAFEVYPCDIAGVPGGQFDGFDLSDNSLTQVRSEGVTLVSSGGAQTGGPFGFPYGWWWGPYFSPIVVENGIISDNLLSAEALDQFYTDLDAGTGSLFVDGNPGIDADDPTIATAKGYAVFGSVPPETSLLLNFNGTNGSTTFTDSSPNGFSATVVGDAQISTAQSKFGGASGYFDGDGDYVSFEQSGSELTFGTEDFTVEFWMRDDGTALNGFRSVVSQAPVQDEGLWFGRFDNNSTYLLLGSNGSWAVLNAISGNPFDGDWHHIAITRSGSDIKVFLDGDTALSTTTSASITNPSGKFVVGGSPNFSNEAQWFKGYVDDLRVVKGAGLYTANFTPPASELEVYP